MLPPLVKEDGISETLDNMKGDEDTGKQTGEQVLKWWLPTDSPLSLTPKSNGAVTSSRANHPIVSKPPSWTSPLPLRLCLSSSLTGFKAELLNGLDVMGCGCRLNCVPHNDMLKF